jgi:WD40 repeat protein
MDAAGRITAKAPLVNYVVTAACYDPSTECLLLGVKDGTVYPVNKYNRVLETLAAHKSRCVSITMLDPVVVTGGYDKNAFIWNMDNLLFETGLNFREELETEHVEKRVVNSGEIPTEWLVPVDYSFDGWTLAVCADADGKSVWIGTSAGNVMLLNSSADDMAQQLRRKFKRNLTQQEWTRYVGVSIPYMTFK